MIKQDTNQPHSKPTVVSRFKRAGIGLLAAALVGTALMMTASPAQAATTSFWIGYGNIGPFQGKNDGPTANDTKKIDETFKLIQEMGVSLFVASELHEDGELHGHSSQLEYFKKNMAAKMGSQWAVAYDENTSTNKDRSGGNHLIYDKNKYKQLSATTTSLGSGDLSRMATKWNMERIDTGVKFWVVGYHAPAQGDHTTSQIQTAQKAQMTQLVDSFTNTLHRVVFTMDTNDFNNNVSIPILLQKKPAKNIYSEVKNMPGSGLDSFHGDTSSAVRHIDLIATGDLVDFNNGAQINTRNRPSSLPQAQQFDHDFLKAQVTIR